MSDKSWFVSEPCLGSSEIPEDKVRDDIASPTGLTALFAPGWFTILTALSYLRSELEKTSIRR